MFEEKLIREVEKNDCLWNKQSSDFKNKRKKDACWSNISRVIGESELACRKRWKSLRDRYIAELTTKHIATDQVINMNTRQDWQHCTKLDFLKNCATSKGEESRQEDQQDKPMPPKPLDTQPNNADAYKSWHKVSGETKVHASEMVAVPPISIDTPPEGKLVTSLKQLHHSVAVEDPLRILVDNYMNFINKHKQSSDPFLSVIEEFFRKAPQDKRISFKMDILNYTHRKFAEIHEPKNK